MNSHVKRTLEVLDALGFTRQDDPFGRRKWSFQHAYEPAAVLKVWEGQSEAACIAVQQKAHAIADTGTAGPKMPKGVGRRKHCQQQRTGPTVMQLAFEDRKAARREREEHRERSTKAAAAERNRIEIESLMQPGTGR